MIFSILIIGLVAYILGSFSSAYWLCQWRYHIDIREFGSGNAGATNVLRVKGWKMALPVFFLDTLKSFLAVHLAVLPFVSIPADAEVVIIIKIGLGLMSVVGHMFPLFSGFRGGKGVASLLGVVLALHPLAALASLGVFLAVLLAFRIVSLASVLAGVSFPLWIFFGFTQETTGLKVFSLLAALLILISHKRNLNRLLNGQEKRIRLK